LDPKLKLSNPYLKAPQTLKLDPLPQIKPFKNLKPFKGTPFNGTQTPLQSKLIKSLGNLPQFFKSLTPTYG